MNIEERIARLRNQVTAKKSAANEAYESAQNDLFLVEKERRDGLAKIEASEAQVRTKREELSAERKKQEADLSFLIENSYRSVEEVVLDTIQKNNRLLSAH